MSSIGRVSDEAWAAGLAWMRSRPPVIQALMRRLPPSCQVTSDGVYLIPGPDRPGSVASYTEDGQVSVADTELGLRAFCDPDRLRVVGYHQTEGRPLQDEAWVAQVLDGLDG